MPNNPGFTAAVKEAVHSGIKLLTQSLSISHFIHMAFIWHIKQWIYGDNSLP